MSPELMWNPHIKVLPNQLTGSYARLRICVQRGDAFSASKSGMSRPRNLSAALQWLHTILPQLSENHKKILLVTYQNLADTLWARLQAYHHVLIPYIDGTNTPQPKLPYFGGMNGSNLYQAATCVVCLGLNRFEPRDYLSRTIALDFTGERVEEMKTAVAQPFCQRLDQLPSVMDVQDITLARALVQVAFRSALRRHGETVPIDLWLLQPPNGVLGYLQRFYQDCSIMEIPDLPQSCKDAAAIAGQYKGVPTHAAKLLDWLRHWDGQAVTPAEIRAQTGLTQAQFKEAKKHTAVKRYFTDEITVQGSGQNARYRRKLLIRPEPPPAK